MKLLQTASQVQELIIHTYILSYYRMLKGPNFDHPKILSQPESTTKPNKSARLKSTKKT